MGSEEYLSVKKINFRGSIYYIDQILNIQLYESLEYKKITKKGDILLLSILIAIYRNPLISILDKVYIDWPYYLLIRRSVDKNFSENVGIELCNSIEFRARRHRKSRARI